MYSSTETLFDPGFFFDSPKFEKPVTYATRRAFSLDRRFVFKTREAAEEILSQLRSQINVFKFAFIGDLYLFMGFGFVDNYFQYRWTTLATAFVTFTSDGYRLCLPVPEDVG